MSIRRLLGNLYRKRLAPLANLLRSRAWHKHYPRETIGTREGLQRLCERLLELTCGRVFGGPFAGMVLPENSRLRNEPNIIVGCYEEELHGVVSDVLADPPSRVIDIGAAHGYYAVGFAFMTSQLRVTAFEMKENLRSTIEELAEANGVRQRVDLRGECTSAALQEELSGGEASFILCDCEGFEQELLNLETIPGLAGATVLCELHDFYAPGLTGTLVQRFKETHSIEIIDETPRTPQHYRILRTFPPHLAQICCDETRHIENPWRLVSGRFMVMRPKAG